MIARRAIQAGAGAALAAAIGAAMVLGRMARVREWVDQFLQAAQAGSSGHLLAFCLGQVAITLCGVVPASLMAVMAGALFGLVDGLAISIACTMLGGWFAFLLSRSVLRPWIEWLMKRYPGTARFDQAVGSEGWRFVCLLRISPIMPFAATSYGLGLTTIAQRDFLLGTLASLPSLAAYVALGASGMRGLELGNARSGPLQWLLLVVGLATVLWAVMRVKHLMKQALASETV